MYRRALAINEQSFGAEHPEVATTLNNLAGLATSANRFHTLSSVYVFRRGI